MNTVRRRMLEERKRRVGSAYGIRTRSL